MKKNLACQLLIPLDSSTQADVQALLAIKKSTHPVSSPLRYFTIKFEMVCCGATVL